MLARPEQPHLNTTYLDFLLQLERLSYLPHALVQDELARAKEWGITSVQAFLLFNMGERELCAGDFFSIYFGTNVSHNLKKLFEGGYLSNRREGLFSFYKRTPAGNDVAGIVARCLEAQTTLLQPVGGISLEALQQTSDTLNRLQNLWEHQLRFPQ